METPTIVKRTRDYLLTKVPLPQKMRFNVAKVPNGRTEKMTRAEKRLLKIIQEGEREYREGKTIRAGSIDEALKIYERRQKDTR